MPISKPSTLWYAALFCISATVNAAAPDKVTLEQAEEKGCLSCHEGIEDFTAGRMMDDIIEKGEAVDDEAGCTVCHGGNPLGLTKEEAHHGSADELKEKGGPDRFYPDPGSVWIAERTCGQCHAGYAERLAKSLMNTEAGKLQGNLWSWGLAEDMTTVYGNYDMTDDDGIKPAVGSKAYKKYMQAFAKAHPKQMPVELKQVPEVNLDDVSAHPNLAGITYSRHECQRCHVGVQGREKRGDYRGLGCSSCHVPYSNQGLYEGDDPTIDKTRAGHPLAHVLQATRKSKVKVGDLEYSGIPNETCNTCHNRGKRIGVSYQGIMEFPYGSPYDEKGKKQPKLHTKKYLFIKDDLHHQLASRDGNPKGGLLCQDCHTSIDMHGDGNIPGTTLAQVEIECQDCHGTTEKLPWELPLGTGEEFQTELGDSPRGLAKKLPRYQRKATKYKAEDGYLITARGNPFGNVVKRGDKVIVHSASGLDFESPLLKTIHDTDSYATKDGKVAMAGVAQHMESMECYACHADWVPQCYGCHITVDYSNGKTSVDWIKNANSRGADGLTADSALGSNGLEGPGKVSETRSYLRWETPILGINGEGNVTPLMPGCQVITTVIDKDGKTVAHNEIWNTPDGKGLDHAAVQPHTAGRKARSCESCHNNPKTLGYGIEDGRFMANYDKDLIVDLTTATGEVIPKQVKVQSPAIPKLDHDLSQIVTHDGKQLVSVGSHWELTGPLPQEMREKMERSGLCLACHEKQADAEFWAKVSKEGWLTNDQHKEVLREAIEALAAQRAK